VHCDNASADLVVDHEPLDDVLLELVGRPLPEADRSGAADPEAKREDHVEVVVGDLVLLAIRGSCSEKPNNCPLGQLAVLEDVLDVLADRPLRLAEQLGELALAEPYRFVFETNVELGAAVLAPVEEYLPCRRGILHVTSAITWSSSPAWRREWFELDIGLLDAGAYHGSLTVTLQPRQYTWRAPSERTPRPWRTFRRQGVLRCARRVPAVRRAGDPGFATPTSGSLVVQTVGPRPGGAHWAIAGDGARSARSVGIVRTSDD
jgi:hypothetical protein